MVTRYNGVSAETSDTFMIGPGAVYAGFTSIASPGTLIGATKGGNTFTPGRTITNLPCDGTRGKVKGHDRITNVAPVITCNMVEISKANFMRAIAGSNQAAASVNVLVTREIVGVGDDSQTAFQLNGGSGGADEGTILAASYTFWENDPEVGDSGDVLLAETTDYSVNTTTGAVTLVAALADEHVLIASYTRVTSDSSTHDIVTGGDIEDSDYISNIAIIGELQGSTNPFVAIVSNVLSEGGITISLAEEDNTVLTATFEGRFDGDALSTEPWAYWHPAS